MPRTISNGGRFEVHCSAEIGKKLKQIQRRATLEGRGDKVLRAIREIWHRLTDDPSAFGEPLYHLPALRLQIRHAAVGPLLVHFGVHEVKALVFLKLVTLLPEQGL